MSDLCSHLLTGFPINRKECHHRRQWKQTTEDIDVETIYIANNFAVSQTGADSSYFGHSPRVGGSSAGFIVAWDGNGNIIRARKYDSSGNPALLYSYNPGPTTGEAQVNQNTAASRYQPDADISANGSSVVVWRGYMTCCLDQIFAQRFDGSGNRATMYDYLSSGTTDANTRVNQNAGVDNISPATAASDGSFVVVWDEGNNIWAQRYDSLGNRASMYDYLSLSSTNVNTRVNDTTSFTRNSPDVAMSPNPGASSVVWQDSRFGYNDIFLQCYNSDGTANGSNQMVNDPSGYRQNIYPRVAMNSLGNSMVVWGRDDGKVYARMYNSSCAPLGSPFMVNDQTPPNYSMDDTIPSVAANGNDDFMVVWNDLRNDPFSTCCSGNNTGSGYDIFAQQYDNSGNPIGGNFRIDDNNSTIGNEKASKSPSIAGGLSDSFFSAHFDKRGGNQEILAEFINP